MRPMELRGLWSYEGYEVTRPVELRGLWNYEACGVMRAMEFVLLIFMPGIA